MLKTGKWYISLVCMAVMPLSGPGIAHADTYFCKAEHASGYVYDLENKSWQASSLAIENRTYLISKADTENVFIKALNYDYEIKKAGSSKPIIHCKSVKLNDSNQETGLVTCRGSLGESFHFDKRSGRYIRSQPSGYLSSELDSESGNGPYMEIGNCSAE